jgi:hypothetical protein
VCQSRNIAGSGRLLAHRRGRTIFQSRARQGPMLQCNLRKLGNRSQGGATG